MAYLDLSQPRAAALSVPAFVETRFTGREWATIALARFDTPASLSARSRFRRLTDAIFSVRRTNSLADPRLEALRRMVVILRSGGQARNERARFLAAGFSTAQLETLERQTAA